MKSEEFWAWALLTLAALYMAISALRAALKHNGLFVIVFIFGVIAVYTAEKAWRARHEK